MNAIINKGENMKKIFVFILSALFLTSCSSNSIDSSSENNDVDSIAISTKEETTIESEPVEPIAEPSFRNAKWGMSIDEVKATEDLTITSEDSSGLVYNSTNISGLSAIPMFAFENGSLYRGVYKFDVYHTDMNQYIEDYNNIHDALIEKYGTPDDDQTIWENDLYKNDKDDWGLAVYLGDLSFASRWNTDTTEIMLFLQGSVSKDLELVCAYTDVNYINDSNSDTEGL